MTVLSTDVHVTATTHKSLVTIACDVKSSSFRLVGFMHPIAGTKKKERKLTCSSSIHSLRSHPVVVAQMVQTPDMQRQSRRPQCTR